MERNLSGAERKVRLAMGLFIAAFGVYTLTLTLWLGLFIIAVGVFTAYEGYAGWTAVHALTKAWIRPEGGNIEVPHINSRK